MSGLEDLLSQIPTSDIASKIGVDEAEVNQAVQLLVPVLVGGLSENAQDPEHASKIESAADSHAGLLDGGVNVDQVDQNEGQQAIARIFGGNDADQVASALAGGGGGNGRRANDAIPCCGCLAGNRAVDAPLTAGRRSICSVKNCCRTRSAELVSTVNQSIPATLGGRVHVWP